MGRKPLPTRLHVLKGTFRKDRNNTEEVELSTGPENPKPPDYFTIEAKAEWKRLIGELTRSGLLTTADHQGFIAYCQAVGVFTLAQRAWKRGGCKISEKTKNGRKVHCHELVAMRLASDDMRRCASELGLSPTSRTKVHAKIPLEQDPAKKYLAA